MESSRPSKASKRGWRIGYLGAAAALYLADQATKAWAVKSLRFGQDRTAIRGFLDFVYTENPGIAFGQLQEGGAFGRWLLVVLASLAALAVTYYFFRTVRNDDRILGACALLLAGIAGNLTDRVRLGYVIDFILVHIGPYNWPTFNIADASICLGAALFAFDLIFEGRRNRAADQQSSEFIVPSSEFVTRNSKTETRN
jgi:signal peptidase II